MPRSKKPKEGNRRGLARGSTAQGTPAQGRTARGSTAEGTPAQGRTARGSTAQGTPTHAAPTHAAPDTPGTAPRSGAPCIGSAPRRTAPSIDTGREYAPVPVPPLPPVVPVPAGWHDTPGFVLRPWAVANAAPGPMPAQLGVLGRTAKSGDLVAQSYQGCFAHGIFGPPDSGKSYFKGLHVENALLQTPYLNRLAAPLCVVSLHYENGHRAPDLYQAHLPNQVPAEVTDLMTRHGSQPQGLPDCLALCLPDHLDETREQHPHWQVHRVAFSTQTLGVVGLKLLMGFADEADAFYGQLFEELLRQIGPDLCAESIAAAIDKFPDRGARRLLRHRWLLARDFIDDSLPSLRRYVRPGRLIVLDLRDGWLAPHRAMRLLAALNYALLLSAEGGPLPCNVMLCVDEVHKFCKHAVLRAQLEFLARERRHLGLCLLFSSQDPPSIPQSILDELDGIAVFRMDSTRWLSALGHEFAAFQRVPISRFVNLGRFELLFWARSYWVAPGVAVAPDGAALLYLRARPRLSQHGGATRTAI